MILQTMRIALLSIERVYLDEGGDRAAARKDIARKLGIGPGTLENLIRDRVKTINANVAAKVRRLWIETIEAKLARLERERELAGKIDIDLPATELGNLEAILEKARIHLDEIAKKKKGR